MTDATSFFDTLVRLEIELWNEIDARLRDDGVTLARYQALRAVHEHDGRARVHEVAQDLGITVGAASKLVDRLEQDGSARREPNPDDRRSSLIALTPDGVRRYAAASATFAAAAEAALPANLRSDELGALTRRLDGVRRHLASRGTEATA
jgi:DNA-binding MarR family transcriptional regulator